MKIDFVLTCRFRSSAPWTAGATARGHGGSDPGRKRARMAEEDQADEFSVLNPNSAKLSEMILDQKLNGTLDQGVGVLIVYDEEQVSSTYENSLKTIKNTAEVLDTLYAQAKQLT
ncbi:psmd11a [Symbiodinium natans]|uniref:Psmd11a protein n=1 Tax=Symbiodinium natans TaxID=878477 RepID=A0A812UPI5_9DINO|nr:psmd11a [Symbiodinium natans]